MNNRNIYILVFNCQTFEIDKVRREFNKKFGVGSYKKHISPFVKNGIMSIFKKKPTQKTKWFVLRLADIVELRISKGKSSESDSA